jgi:hypothetical protein
MIIVRILVFILGIIIVLVAMLSAVRTLLISRSAPDPISGTVFRSLRRGLQISLRWTKSYGSRDRVMAYYAPTAMLILLLVWLAMVLIGFMLMFWASGITDWSEAFRVSGSSLLTLGFARADTVLQTTMAFFEAAIGLMLVAILIAYLPTMYNAFSRRENAVTLLETRAGKPPSAAEMILRYHRNDGLDSLRESWKSWESWFAELQESHTALTPLVFFRSVQPEYSWVTAAGTVLDTASLILSAVDVSWDVQAALCVRAGFLALRHIGDQFNVQYNANPNFPDDPISITREEFDLVIARFEEAGVPLKEDREQAWQDFGGWRVNYDKPLLALSQITMAPEAPWTSDRKPIDVTERLL